VGARAIVVPAFSDREPPSVADGKCRPMGTRLRCSSGPIRIPVPERGRPSLPPAPESTKPQPPDGRPRGGDVSRGLISYPVRVFTGHGGARNPDARTAGPSPTVLARALGSTKKHPSGHPRGAARLRPSGAQQQLQFHQR